MMRARARQHLYLILAFAVVLAPKVGSADLLIGGKTTVSAKRGDSLFLLGARYGVDWRIIAKENGFDPRKICCIGQQFIINNLRIVPKIIPEGMVVNVPDRMLYLFRNGALVLVFPVGLGMPQEEWQTPTGAFVITRKTKNPTWYVPVSIQKEMEKKGQEVRTVVPPGKDNPLGRYAIHTTLEGVLLHETIWPTSVYQWRSHGCIRVSPEIMETFFNEVEVGMTGEIIYQPVTLAVREDRVYLQVSRDIYRRIPSMEETVRSAIEGRGLLDRVDWLKVQEAVRKRTGLAEDVTR